MSDVRLGDIKMGALTGIWVVPAIAATLWGVTEDEVLRQVRDGAVASRQELGFMLVYAGPGTAATATAAIPATRRETWVPADLVDAVPPAGTYPIGTARGVASGYRLPPGHGPVARLKAA